MADIGDILNVTNRETSFSEIFYEDIEANIAFGMSEVRRPVYGGPAYVYSYLIRNQRFEFFF